MRKMFFAGLSAFLPGLWAPATVSATAESLEPIVVGEPKVFDNRDLEILLEDLQGQLAAVDTIDSAKLLAAIDTLQGSQARSRAINVVAKPVPTPAFEETKEVNATGELAVKSQKTTEASQAPTPPEVPALSLTMPVTNFGTAAQDLLTRQTDLEYQIANIQMLLQRAISDRFYDGGPAANGEPGARLLVVVGFQISLRPRAEHKGMAAEVQIEITPRTAGRRRPLLVALMPQQKTYNAASLSKKSTAFGAVAPVGAFTLGASANFSGETFYLYRDIDTYAFEVPAVQGQPSVGFGWQFRPVLGQPSVDAGIRQLFAVIALDEKDVLDDGRSQGEPVVPMYVTARTFWSKFNAKKRFPKGGPLLSAQAYKDLSFPVPKTAHLHAGLTPKISEATLETIGGGKALVKIRGENFDLHTSVAIGDRVLEPGSSAFQVRSNNQLQFVAPLKDILGGETTLTAGRYGFPTPVRQRVEPNCKHDNEAGFRVEEYGFCGKRKGDFVELEVLLAPRGNQAGQPNLQGRAVFIEIGGEIYELPASRWRPAEKICGDPLENVPNSMLWAQLDVPFKLRDADSELVASIPFLGEEFRHRSAFHPPIGVTGIIQLESGDNSAKSPKETVWGLVGYGFSPENINDLTVYAGAAYNLQNGLSLVKDNDKLLKLSAPKTALAEVKEVVVVARAFFEPKVFKAPTQPPAKPKPSAELGPVAAKLSSGSVIFKGKNLKAVQKIKFEDKPLDFTAKSDEEIVVFLNRTVTKETGKVILLAFTDETTFIPLEITVQ